MYVDGEPSAIEMVVHDGSRRTLDHMPTIKNELK